MLLHTELFSHSNRWSRGGGGGGHPFQRHHSPALSLSLLALAHDDVVVGGAVDVSHALMAVVVAGAAVAAAGAAGSG